MLSSSRRWTTTACVSLLLVFAFAGGASALSEVWIGPTNTGIHAVERHDFSGSFLGSFGVGGEVGAIEVVGSEVWIGPTNTGIHAVERHDFSGSFLGSFGVGGEVGAIAVIPEPSTALLLGLGLAGMAAASRRRVR